MDFETAFAEIRQFWPGEQPFAFSHAGAAARLSTEYTRRLPPHLVEYLDLVAPAQNVVFDTPAKPMTFYGLPRLGPRQDGYSWDAVTQAPITDWNPDFFMLGAEGNNPIMIDLGQPGKGIMQFWRDADNPYRDEPGHWDEGLTSADTMGQMLLCAAACHYALHNFESPPFTFNKDNFLLAPQVAGWLLPRLRNWAGPYYDAWIGYFDNA